MNHAFLRDGVGKTERSEMAYEILAYLAENPEAQDTLEGVVEWWLLRQRIKSQKVKVGEALASLVNEGLVCERRGKDSRTHYRINRRKYKSIQAILKERTEQAKDDKDDAEQG